jgi:maltose alpha-D-glucosyltransferase/alpha-amylase
VHFTTRHRDDVFTFAGEEITGGELADRVRDTLDARLSGPLAAYNRRFTTNGIACTTATVIAATLGIQDLAAITPRDRGRIRDVHLLLAMFNALQPGVFALSGWDLAGMLTVDAAKVPDLIADGDTRWINRGAHDLRGVDEPATEGRMPTAPSLYGTLGEQLADPGSFASRLARIVEVRRRFGIASATQIDVPDVSNKAQLVMVHNLDGDRLEVTVLNFSAETLTGSVRSQQLPPEAQLTDMLSGEDLGTVDDLHSFSLELGAYEGRALLVEPTNS